MHVTICRIMLRLDVSFRISISTTSTLYLLISNFLKASELKSPITTPMSQGGSYVTKCYTVRSWIKIQKMALRIKPSRCQTVTLRFIEQRGIRSCILKMHKSIDLAESLKFTPIQTLVDFIVLDICRNSSLCF